MSLIEWDEEKFSVLVGEMDQQHQKWIGLINKLHDALTNEGADISPEEALKEMQEYTKYHFAKEEQLMRNAGYPDYKTHLQAHVYFISELMELEHELRSGHWILKSQIMGILKRWLEDHILKTDRLYGEFITENKPQ